MPTLSDAQRVVLAQAAARDSRRVLPTPASLSVKGGALTALLRGLLARGLLAEVPAAAAEAAWRGEEGRRLALVVTDAGCLAIGVELEAGSEPATAVPEPQGPAAAPTEAQEPVPAPAARPTKQERIIALLHRPEGATLAQLMEATGWQAHSVRGALATLRNKRGLDLCSEKADGLRTYCLPA